MDTETEELPPVAEIEAALKDLIANGGSKGEIEDLTAELIDAREEAAHTARLAAERQRVEADMAREKAEAAAAAEAKRAARDRAKAVAEAEKQAKVAAQSVHEALEALEAAYCEYTAARAKLLNARADQARAEGKAPPPKWALPGFRLKGAMLITTPTVFRDLGLKLVSRGGAKRFDETEG